MSINVSLPVNLYIREMIAAYGHFEVFLTWRLTFSADLLRPLDGHLPAMQRMYTEYGHIFIRCRYI